MFINEDTSTQQITHIYFTKLIPTKHIEIHTLYTTTTTTSNPNRHIQLGDVQKHGNGGNTINRSAGPSGSPKK